jgi:hypothetical protein
MMTQPTRSNLTRRTKRKKWIIFFAILATLVGIRLLLPYYVLHVVNKNLASMQGYYGHVRDIDLSLYRGAYIVKDIGIDKVDTASDKHTRFFHAPKVDISIEWRSLFKGRIVSELYLYSPVLRFTEDAAEPEQMEKDSNDFRKILKTFTPIKVNRFEVIDGTIAYQDPGTKPVVNIEMTGTHILGYNLSNVVDTTALPARVSAQANVYGGKLDFNMRVNALAEYPTYDLNVELKDAQLVQLNDFFEAYADFDINQGVFGLYMELAAKDRKFIGYVKPFIRDLDVVNREDRKDPLLREIWEGIVGIAGDILEAPKSDVIATKIPIAGQYDNRRIGIWYAIYGALRNGFFKALSPVVDDQVTLTSVDVVEKGEVKKGGFFRRVFGAPDKPKKDKPDKSSN